MPFKPNYGTNPSTDLDPVIAGIPWLDGFAPGVGVNALTGALAGNAVKPFTPKPAARSGGDATYKFVESSRDLSQEIEARTKGKYNIEGVNVNASAEYINKIKYSETSITLLATYEVYYGDYEVADKYELIEEAQKLVSHPEKFRARYGDYFVSGYKKMSRFVGIFVCQSSSAELFQSFQASLGQKRLTSLALKAASNSHRLQRRAAPVYTVRSAMSGVPEPHQLSKMQLDIILPNKS